MLASTLIKRLQEQIDERGDLPVFAGHSTATYPVNSRITKVDFINEGSKTIWGDLFVGGSSWPDCIRLHTK